MVGGEAGMNNIETATIKLTEDRFDRFRRITWWDQTKIRDARVLVIGAGALGNEVIKNLALLGIGNVAIVDMDHIEKSNLCRSVLFRTSDEGRPKAVVAAESARSIYPEMQVTPLVGNLLADIGLGWFRWADVVVGALDNREARVAVNSNCAQTGTAWIDGGIEVLNGIVRGFAPPETACYECTMGETDWDQLNKRRSCSLLARNAFAGGGTPTTPTTASVIGAIQAQEVVKRLHDLDALSGTGYVFEGLGHNSYPVAYSINPDCPWHEPPAPIQAADALAQTSSLADVCAHAAEQLGGLDALDLAREVVVSLNCGECQATQQIFQPIDRIPESEALCKRCGGECYPELAHSIEPNSSWTKMTVAEFGLPGWDVIWARHGSRAIGIELAGDRANVGAPT